MNTSPLRLQSDRGLSLVELAVYVLVLGIIATVIATVMASLFRSEQTVSDVTTASNDSQNISTMLTNDIRNAREFRVGAPGEMIASVASRGQNLTWQCVKWVVVATSNNSLVRQETADIPGSKNWPAGLTLADNMQTIGEPYFARVGLSDGTATLEYAFGLKSASDSPFPVQGQVSNQKASDGSNCWS